MNVAQAVAILDNPPRVEQWCGTCRRCTPTRPAVYGHCVCAICHPACHQDCGCYG